MGDRSESPRRSDHYYRQLFLEKYIENRPRRGLGRHRLPRLWPNRTRRPPPQEARPIVRIVLLLTVLTFTLVCVLMCLTVVGVTFQ